MWVQHTLPSISSLDLLYVEFQMTPICHSQGMSHLRCWFSLAFLNAFSFCLCLPYLTYSLARFKHNHSQKAFIFAQPKIISFPFQLMLALHLSYYTDHFIPYILLFTTYFSFSIIIL